MFIPVPVRGIERRTGGVPMRLRAYPNVISLADWRRTRGADKAVRFQMCVPPGCFVGWSTEPAAVDAGRRLGEAVQERQPAPSGWRRLANAVWKPWGLRKH
jgi:hypothetical protein